MPDSKLTFDADTASYNARMDESRRRTKGLVEEFKGMAAPLIEAATLVGAIGLAIDAVKSQWDEWREQVRLAGEENKKVGTTLAGALGTAGLLPQYQDIKRAIQNASGPLSTDQKEGSAASFLGSRPGATKDELIQSISQSEKAAQIIGPENITRFTEALGLAMQAGLSQKRAGDVAISVAQSGDQGPVAFHRAVSKYFEEYDTPESRKSTDLIKYIQGADPEDLFGTRNIIGGKAIKDTLSRDIGGSLDRQSAAAPGIDRDLAKQREMQAMRARAATDRQHEYGSRAELEEESQVLVESLRAHGQHRTTFFDPFMSDRRLEERVSGLRHSYQQVLADPSQGVSKGQAADALRAIHETLKETQRDASNKGAPKFRHEAQNRDP